MARPPLPEGQRREHYVALRLTGDEKRPVQAVADFEHSGNLSDAIRALLIEALAARTMSRAELEAEIAALRDELTKVKGHRAELSERCYRKDLELDELRIRDRGSRADAPGSPVAVSTSVDGMSPAEWGFSNLPPRCAECTAEGMPRPTN